MIAMKTPTGLRHLYIQTNECERVSDRPCPTLQEAEQRLAEAADVSIWEVETREDSHGDWHLIAGDLVGLWHKDV
jgi:hypothetical protein